MSCNIQLATCNLQTAAFNLQLSTCSFQPATCNLQVSTCNLQASSGFVFDVPEIGIFALDPILARRNEYVICDEIFGGLGFVHHVGRYVEHFVGANIQSLAVDIESPPAAYHK